MLPILLVFAAVGFAPTALSQETFLLPDITPFDSVIIKNVSWYWRAGSYKNSDILYIEDSYDFQEWSRHLVINETNLPRWATSKDFRDPVAALLGTDYGRVYFSAKEKITLKQVIGVAFSEYFGSEYYTTNLPLVTDPTQDLVEPSIATDNLGTYLFYRGVKDNQIHVVQLTPEGIQVRSWLTMAMGPTEDWEGGQISKYFVTRHGNYYYIFYTGNDPCSDKAAIGVARSAAAYGPYEKRPGPLLTTKNFRNARHMCDSHPQTYLNRFITWGEDAWPSIIA